MCVCVCERERERKKKRKRERERERERELIQHINRRGLMLITRKNIPNFANRREYFDKISYPTPITYNTYYVKEHVFKLYNGHF